MEKILYYGDNLPVLRAHFQDELVDLVYLDPPFNSKANYNVLFGDKSGRESTAQIEAFKDSWHWTEEAEKTYQEIIELASSNVVDMISAFRNFIKQTDLLAYLVMMTIRLIELRRVLKNTGLIFLHCDQTASHYLKIIMDSIFGLENFRNELIWKRASTIKGNFGQGSKFFGINTDTILFYSKSEDYFFEQPFKEYSEEYLDKFYKYFDEKTGKRYRLISMIGPGGAKKGNPFYEVMGIKRYWRYSEEKMAQFIKDGLVIQTKPGTVPVKKQFLEDGKGVAVQNLWDDINALTFHEKESLGYPTQKPRALLERIIMTCAEKQAIVLDPFCGCGTTISACENLNKNENYNLTWLGIDITHLAINLIKGRLYGEYSISPKKDYQVIGEPKDLGGAIALSEQDRYQFQWWALSLVNARPYGEKKKGSDKGIDGIIYFIEYPENKTEKAIVQVKSGKVKSGDIRDLKGVVEREQAVFGIFITLQQPSKDMKEEATISGFWKNLTDFPKIQILTIEDILSGSRAKIPYQVYHSKEAKRIGKKDSTGKLF